MTSVVLPRGPVPPAAPDPARDVAEHAARGLRAAATSAGAGILLLAVLAPFGVLYAVNGLVTPGDAARTARDVAGSETLFLLGVVSLLLAAAVDILVAWGLYRVFRRASGGLSMLAAWLRLAYAAVFLGAIGHLAAVPRLLHAPAGAFNAAQNHARALAEIEAFHDVFSAALTLFGAHLLLIGYLAFRSGFVPRLLAALVALAGVGYAFDSVAGVLSNESMPSTATVTFVGEFILGIWLLARRRSLTDAPTPTTARR